MAGSDFGGLMRVRTSTGTLLSLRGTFTVSPGNLSAEAITNQDGSADRIGTPQAPSAEIVFADKNVDLSALIGAPRQNVTVIEDFTGLTHQFTRAFFTGKPSSNRMNGEVSGVGLTAEFYRKVG